MTRGNPFTVTFGKQPNKVISRYEDVDQIVSTFDAEHAVSQTFLIEGIRGSGKTVLMTTVAGILSEKKDWIVINLNPALDLLTGFALRLSEACGVKSDLLKRGFQVSAAGFGVGINAPESADPVGTIDRSFKNLMKKKKKVLITIDEAVDDDNMKVFASQFQIFVRQDYPIFLIMTGLYENINRIQNNPSLTFLLRVPKVTTGPLSMLQISHQYREIFDVDEDRATELAEITKGYAFAFQALGVCCWEYKGSDDRLILEKLDELLDDYVYKKIWASLTPKEREIVKAMHAEEEKVGTICERLNMSNGSFSRYKENLMDKGILYASGYGHVAPALPRFREVVKSYRV